jgi:DNA-binding NarL/FixJ family response regulator
VELKMLSKFEEAEYKPSQKLLDILQLVAEGYKYSEIEKRMGLSRTTIGQMVYYAVNDFGFKGRVPFIIHAIRKGWIKG